MSNNPFILQRAMPAPAIAHSGDGDGVTDSDELPTVLVRHADGHFVASGTRLTEVAKETTDDT